MLTRRKLLSLSAVTSVLAALFGALGAARAVGLNASRVRVTSYGLTPRGWPGDVPLRIVILTDFHANRSSMGASDILAAVEQANGLSPDLVVLLGDYCSQDRGALTPEEVAPLFHGIRARFGVYAVQGNHDWRDDRAALRAGKGPTRVERAFRKEGIPFLSNQSVPLGDTGIWLAGIESEAQPDGQGRIPKGEALDAHRPFQMERTLKDVPADATVILLAHEPDVFAGELDPRIALTLSGHTHGGQVRILGWSPFIPSRYGLRYAYGHVVERGRDLVVSGGLGSHFVAGHPLRIGMPPEIVSIGITGRPQA